MKLLIYHIDDFPANILVPNFFTLVWDINKLRHLNMDAFPLKQWSNEQNKLVTKLCYIP